MVIGESSKGSSDPDNRVIIRRKKILHATASQVTSERLDAAAVFTTEIFDDEPASHILPALKQDAKISGRDHLLVRRRRRERRLATR